MGYKSTGLPVNSKVNITLPFKVSNTNYKAFFTSTANGNYGTIRLNARANTYMTLIQWNNDSNTLYGFFYTVEGYL